MTPPDFDFETALREKFREVGFGWDIKGIIDSNKRIYTVTDDTKLISKVFELMTRPVIYEFGDAYDLKVYESDRQTVYPDFTLEGALLGDKKIAVDVKSTYRRFLKSGAFRANFTLGSYTAYLRDPTKNIMFPYDQYSQHWIVGFVYTRETEIGQPKIVTLQDLDEIVPPIRGVETIIQQKYKIASERPGSGNTANIGSVNDITQLRNGSGPFAQYGEEIFEDYWRNFMTARMARQAGKKRSFSDLETYFRWRIDNPGDDVELPPEVIQKFTNQATKNEA